MRVDSQGTAVTATATTPRAPGFRYYDLLVGGMVAVLLCSNLIGPAKVCTLTLPLLGALVWCIGCSFSEHNSSTERTLPANAAARLGSVVFALRFFWRRPENSAVRFKARLQGQRRGR